ncbi:hypothetical protein NIES4101_62510 [Calothrix sp. NIES-4101]|nr:hypothetical protein NIES4101_34810 [Calothrix sp. NIES-4101]BAZ40290.1 hypothetical protein NIES4101_62510 [Calothrix sp. NIES-4101]
MLRNGYVVWEGASLIDGSPIVLILTGFVNPTSNRKTGRQLQSWILSQNYVLRQQLLCVRNDKQ